MSKEPGSIQSLQLLLLLGFLLKLNMPFRNGFKTGRKPRAIKNSPTQITGNIPINPAIEYAQTLKGVVEVVFSDLDSGLQKGIVISGVCKKHPELRDALEPHKPKLILDSPLLSPTELGALMDPPLSARAVNKLLCDRNLQQPTGEKNPTYRLIGSGNEFGKVVADTARGHGKTVQHVRWYESVMDLLG
jgi:hypothetical protein